MSGPHPMAALRDDFEPRHDAALGAWYPFAHGLHSHTGLTVFRDQASISARARRQAWVDANVVEGRQNAPPETCDQASSPYPEEVAFVDVMGDLEVELAEGEGEDYEVWHEAQRQVEESYYATRPWSIPGAARGGQPCRRRTNGLDAGISDKPARRPDRDGEITAEQAANGIDMQGIPWENLPFSREDYRATRLRDTSPSLRRDSTDMNESLRDELKTKPTKGASFYEFFRNTRQVKCSIVHFQLRNLAWATSEHDVFVMHDAAVVHWDAASRRKRQVLDLSGSGNAVANGLGMVQISTMIAKEDLVIAGGFYGELIAKNLKNGTIIHNKRITYDENAITNAIDIFGSTIMTSNNDCCVRCFDMSTFQKKSSFEFAKPVNHATRQPNGKMVAVAGDHHSIQVIDGDKGDKIALLRGHEDFSFATSWHPNGRMFATGSQDKTCRIWDVRNMSQSFCVLDAVGGAVRSLRFSSCGTHLMMAEPRDFVHIFDVNRGEFDTCQEIDLFGEIAGIALTPSAEGLYIAVSDRTYSSLIEYKRRTDSFVSEVLV